MKIGATLVVPTAITLLSGVCGASAQSPDEQRVYIARDVCAAFTAKWASAPGGSVNFDAGKFSVHGNSSTVTIFENNVRLAQIPGFSYSSFNECLDKIIDGLERSRRSAESKLQVEAFTAGAELGALLSIGRCFRSAAMGGFYLGDMEQNGQPIPGNTLSKMVAAVGKSIGKRLSRLGGQEVDVELENTESYYQFIRGRRVLYFARQDAVTITSELGDYVPSDYEDYWHGGILVGQMSTEFKFGVALSDLLSTHGQYSAAAQQYFPPTINCLQDAYQLDSSKLGEFEGVFGSNFSPPDMNDALGLQGGEIEKRFREDVVDPIRAELMAN